MIVVSVYDKKVEAFSTPFFCRTVGEGIRSFTEAVKDSQSMIAKYPEDYALYMVAGWDEVAGVFTPEERGPRLVIEAAQAV